MSTSNLACVLFTPRRIISLALVLEDALLTPLVLPIPLQTRGTGLVPLRETFSQTPIDAQEFYLPHPATDSYIPSIEAIKPSRWNCQDPELGRRWIQTIWSGRSPNGVCDLPKYSNRPYGVSFWIQPSQYETTHVGSGRSILFPHLDPTFDHSLFRNWTEVIARIAELAQAGPEEYKKCL